MVLCTNPNPSGNIYQELFEPDMICNFLSAYKACHNDKNAEDKSTLLEMREHYDKSPFGERIFPKPILYVLDKAIQRKFDKSWQRAATEEFESGLNLDLNLNLNYWYK